MSYSRAHLAELGLNLWRPRARAGAAPPDAPVDAVEEAAPAPPSMTTRPEPKAASRRAGLSDHPAGAEDAHAASPAPDDSARVARIMAMDWAELESWVRSQSRGAARQAVFGVGARDAALMVIGEAPGAEEDERGEPFVGRAGQLLDQMLRAIGLNRQDSVYIANICKFRPPNNRDPSPEEVAEDLPYLRRQVQLVAPKVLLAVGRIAAQNLLDRSDPIGRMRGQEFVDAGSGRPVVVTYHPAYLLRSPREKAKAWQDLKRVRSLLSVD